MNGQKPGQMHPDDIRNLILFVVIAIGLWAAYDRFVMKPNVDAQYAKIEQDQKMNETRRLQDTLEVLDPKGDRQTLITDSARIQIDSPELTGSLSPKGGRLDDISLKNHFETLERKRNVPLLSPVGSKYPHYAETGWVASDKSLSLPDKNTLWSLVSGVALTPSTPLVFQWNNTQGLAFERVYSVDDHFMISVTETVRNSTGKVLELYPYSAIARRGKPEFVDKNMIVHDGPLGYIGGELEEIDYSDMGDKPSWNIVSNEGWIGFGQKYWLVGLLPEQTQEKTFRFVQKGKTKNTMVRPLFQTDIMGTALKLEAGQSIDVTHNIYAGIKNVRLLDEYSKEMGVRHFDLAVDFGILYFLTRPLHWLLSLFHSWVGNFGVAIIMLTFLLRLAVFPLANTSYRSFAKMKKLGPQMNELKEKYKEDKASMRTELANLYQKEKVNPMAGCFPILLQIPIFFAMYKVVYISVEMRHAPFFGWIQDLSQPDPTSIFNLFGLLPFDPPSLLMIGIWPCLMIGFMILQQRLNPPPQDPTQKIMMKYFPLFIGFMLSGFASGLVIYWTFSNALSVLQQSVIMKSMGVQIHLFSKDEDELESTALVKKTIRWKR